jgi:hypothetical protein
VVVADSASPDRLQRSDDHVSARHCFSDPWGARGDVYSGWAGQSERATEYRAGWSGSTDGDHYANGHAYYGIKVDVGFGTGAPLFFNNTPILDSIRTAWQGKVAAAASGGPPVTYPSLVDDYLIEAHRDHPGMGLSGQRRRRIIEDGAKADHTSSLSG